MQTNIGAKILLTEIYRIPTAISLGAIGLILLITLGLSLLVKPGRGSTPVPAAKAHQPASSLANTR